MNVASLLAESSRRYGAQPAWVFGHKRATYHEIASRSSRIAAGMQQRLALHSRVVLSLSNRPEFIESLLAAFWAGMVAVPVNRHLHSRELRYVLEHSGAGMLLHDSHTRSTAMEATTEIGDLDIVDVDSMSFAELFAGAPIEVTDVTPESPAWLFYTSGTTGLPKGATLTHRNL